MDLFGELQLRILFSQPAPLAYACVTSRDNDKPTMSLESNLIDCMTPQSWFKTIKRWILHSTSHRQRIDPIARSRIGILCGSHTIEREHWPILIVVISRGSRAWLN